MTNNSNYILTQCNVPKFVDIEILKKYIKKDLESNKEYFNECNMTYRISDSKKAEWILSKSIKNSKLIGNGNTCIDIVISGNNKIGIDVSVLTLTKNYTNEKSIMQNFSQSNNLDELFNINNGETIIEIFRNKFIEKYNLINNEIKDIYYIIFICNNKNIYITSLKLNYEYISYMQFSKFTKSCKNILVSNFIDNKIGNVKLYKSKKRLELRLCKNIIHDDFSIKLY